MLFYNQQLFLSIIIGAYVVDDASIFGVSDKNPLFGEVHCVGIEPDLFECSHSSIGFHYCGIHLDPISDIAISCYGM